mmetsp:Transcript_32187/g.55606  ORF Transcript_32187/g.55606 Transcript_32187/m.55606 type:complete len:96 (-) Transcript_32187:2365-2652(-)
MCLNTLFQAPLRMNTASQCLVIAINRAMFKVNNQEMQSDLSSTLCHSQFTMPTLRCLQLTLDLPYINLTHPLLNINPTPLFSTSTLQHMLSVPPH